MNPVLRSILAVIAGIIVGNILIFGVQMLSVFFYPTPPGLDPTDTEAMKEWIASLPPGALLFVLAAYAVGTFGGAWLAARLAGRAPVLHALFIAVFFFSASVVNLSKYQPAHPTWFVIANLGLFVPVAWLGGRLVTKRQAVSR
jgi:hypothetical protein